MFSRDDFRWMAQQLAAIQGKFLLSLNDVPEIREVFAAFTIEAVQTTYSIGKQRDGSGARGADQELLIMPVNGSFKVNICSRSSFC